MFELWESWLWHTVSMHTPLLACVFLVYSCVPFTNLHFSGMCVVVLHTSLWRLLGSSPLSCLHSLEKTCINTLNVFRMDTFEEEFVKIRLRKTLFWKKKKDYLRLELNSLSFFSWMTWKLCINDSLSFYSLIQIDFRSFLQWSLLTMASICCWISLWLVL